MRSSPAAVPLTAMLLRSAPGIRHGVCLPPVQARPSLSDVRGIVHVGVPRTVQSAWESASGGVGFDAQAAELAAIGEALERYCAGIAEVPQRLRGEIDPQDRVDAEEWPLFTPEQRETAGFPFAAIYADSCPYTNVFALADNREAWIPHPMVVLRDDYATGLPTSSGLAAAPSASLALLRAVQELIERDALMVTWLHSVSGRAVGLPERLAEPVRLLHGRAMAFDITPAYSPFPVAAVAGSIPRRGEPRFSLGVACRETWDDAVEKAYLEWNQGVLFAGVYGPYADQAELAEPSRLRSFDAHAMYYTAHPEQWAGLPLLAGWDEPGEPSMTGQAMETEQALRAVRDTLRDAGIRVYYRDLTTVDARHLGMRVVRAASPDLAAIYAHEEWPLLHRVEQMLASRYPWAHSTRFPNPMPHPLG